MTEPCSSSTLTPEDLAAKSAAYWAHLRRLKLQSGEWSFKNRSYLWEPMHEASKADRGAGGVQCLRQCFMKGTQLGFSEMHVIESLHGLRFKRYSRGVLYIFPTNDDVREFSKSRFSPLLISNPSEIGQFVKETDTANLKRVGDAFLYLRGATLSTQVDVDAKESTKLRSIPVDKIICDELDLMDFSSARKAIERMAASEVQAESYISNPTIPDFGIATLFTKSDQRHWHRHCVCGGWTCAEEEFPNLVGVKDGKGYIACIKCGKPVPNEPGDWVPKERANTEYMKGYQLSQLSSCTLDPYKILRAYQDPPDGNIADIIRLKLGKPYLAAQDRITVQAILSCCCDQPQLDSHAGPAAMGVDVRPTYKNVVIGIRVGRERWRILRVARIQTWSEIMQMAVRFHVRSAVVDIQPDTDAAREFQRAAVRFKVYLCDYSQTTPVGPVYNDNTGILKVNRNEVCDATHRILTSGKMLELPANCPEVTQFARECASVAKAEVIDKRTKSSTFRYRTLDTGVRDDYRHALNYWWLAASGHKLAIADENKTHRQTRAINRFGV